MVITVLVLISLLIFIMQHLTGVRVFFLGAAGTLPLGVAMLFAAIAGALSVALTVRPASCSSGTQPADGKPGRPSVGC